MIAGVLLGAVQAVVHQRCQHCREIIALQAVRVYARDVFGKVIRVGLMHVSADDHACEMRRPWRRRLTAHNATGDEAARSTEGDS